MDSQFFSTSVDEPEGDLDLLVEPMNAMNSQPAPVDEERKGCSGHIGKMMFSAGTEQVATTAGSVRVCVLLSPFLGSKNMQSAHRRYVVLPKAVRNMVQKVALRYGVEVNDFKSKRREYDDSSDLPVDLLAEGAVVIDVCTRALDDVFSRTTEFHRMLHMWHAVSIIDSITGGQRSGSFEPCHGKGYVLDVVGHCQSMEVFHKHTLLLL